MERRSFLNLALGLGLCVAAGAALGGSAEAAPVTPTPLVENQAAPASADLRPAVTSTAEVDQLKPQQVHWGHHWHRHWHHRHWGWHHRHWGWHHRWHHHHWRHHW